jgi:hypothetical protein
MEKYTRWIHTKGIFGPWWAALNAFWAVLSSADMLVSKYASESFQKQWNATWVTPKWGWEIWIIGALLITVLFEFEHSFRHIVKHEKSHLERETKLATKLEEIKTAKPRIKLREPSAIYIGETSQIHGDIRFTSVPFLKVRFINEPAGPYPSAKATDVRATIAYYRYPNNAHFLSIDGRWADSDQPSATSPLTSKSHLLATTFGIGQAHDLDIAYRDPQSGQYYAWNNENYNYQFFRCDRHLLEGDRFRVDVHLLGDWVDEHFSFRFGTTDAGFVID